MNTTSAFISIIGRPNVGKSSLLNAMIGEKVAIVSHRPQTTRNRITGILTEGETQLVFFDTPGMHQPRTRLGDYMVKQVRESISGIDLALLLIEPLGEIHPIEKDLLETLRARNIPAILVVNKIDTLPKKEQMMPKIQAFSQLYDFEDVLPVSALRGDGVPLVLQKAMAHAQPGPHYFDDDAYTDQPERVIVAEIVREQLLRHLRDELPHGTAVEIERMSEREDQAIIDITATIYCEKSSHKGMIIGKHGAMLQKIGTRARMEAERFLDCKVNLQCWVKVRDDWRNREGMIRKMGFE